MIVLKNTLTSFLLLVLLSFSFLNASDLDEFNEESSDQVITAYQQEETVETTEATETETETETTVEVLDNAEGIDSIESLDGSELSEGTDLKEKSDFIESTELTESTNILEVRSFEKPEIIDYKWRLSGRYLGVLSLGGLERAISEQISLGVFYGRYQGKVPGSEKNGLVPGLRSFALQGSAYLGKSKRVFSNGIVAKFGLTYNSQEENPDIKSIQVDGEDVILPGESKLGSLLGIGYHYRWKRLSASAGVEYVTLGSLQSFVPLALTLGLTF